ncbi:MAG: thiamine-binding protein [Anaerolineales bacterium]|jgi:uncharacterized protein YqgV (UPF0045/DUF77 family)
MLTNPSVDTHKVLVELSVVSLGGNGRVKDQVAEVLNIADKAGLFYVRTPNGSCIEGEWGDISRLIYECYARIQAQSPESFINISIR